MENASVAIKEWVELYTAEMVSWAYYKTSQQETSEDLVQETLLQLFNLSTRLKIKVNQKHGFFQF